MVTLNDIGIRESGVEEFSYKNSCQLEKECFSDSAIRQVVLNDVKSIEDYSFSGCSALESLALSGIKTLGNMFGDTSKVSSLYQLNLADDIVDIGTCLVGLPELRNFNFPIALSVIHTDALSNCQFNTVEISHPLKIEKNAFRSLNSLVNIAFPLDNIEPEDGDIGLSTDIQLRTIACETYSASQKVQIKSNTFQNCTANSITFKNQGDKISSISECAFQNLRIRSLDLQNSAIECVPMSAFANCRDLRSIYFPGTIASFEKDCFLNCTVAIPFKPNLTSIQNVGIEYPTFTGYFPMHLKEIGQTAFSNATFEHQDIQLTELQTLEEAAFRKSNASSINLVGSRLTAIPNECFSNCLQLATVNISDKITDIGKNAFNNCDMLAEFNFNSISSIESDAFFGCNVNENLNLSNVEYVGDYAFYNNQAVQHITCNASMLSTGNLGAEIFGNCQNIATIDATCINDKQLHRQLSAFNGEDDPYVLSIDYTDRINSVIQIYGNLKEIFGIDDSKTNFTFYLKDGVTINKDGHADGYKCLKYEGPLLPPNQILIGCDVNEEDYVTFIQEKIIPSNVKTIRTGTFSGRSLTDFDYLDLQYTETLEDEVFRDFTELTSIYLGSKLKNIGDRCFCNCKKLQTISIPETINKIGQQSFLGCIALESIDINSNAPITEIRTKTFEQCPRLVTLVVPRSVVAFENDAFYGSTIQKFYLNNSIPISALNGIAVNSFSAPDKSLFYMPTNDNKYPAFITVRDQIKQVMNAAFVVNADMQLENVDPAYLNGQVTVQTTDLQNISKIKYGAFESANQLTAIYLTNKLYRNSDDRTFEYMINVIVDSTFSEAGYATAQQAFEHAFGQLLEETSEKTLVFADCLVMKTNGHYQVVSYDDPLKSVLMPSGKDIVYEVNDEQAIAAGGIVIAKSTHNEISSYAFRRSDAIASLDTNEITAIADYAFSYNTSIKTVTIGSGMKTIGDNAFKDSGITSLMIPSTLETKEAKCYGLNQAPFLKQLAFGEGMTSIAPSAYIDAQAELTSLSFPKSLKRICQYAFGSKLDSFPRLERLENFDNLQQLSIIEPYSFYNSIRGLDANDKTLQLPNNVLSVMDNAFGYSKYSYTQDVQSFHINVNAGNTKYLGLSSFIYNHIKQLTLNSKLETIDDYAFAYPKYKFDINIPRSVQKIGKNAFYKNVILNPNATEKNLVKIDRDDIYDVLDILGVSIDSEFTAENRAGFTDSTCISAVGPNSNYYSGYAFIESNRMHICPEDLSIDILNRTLVKSDPHAVTSYVPHYIKKIGDAAYADSASLTAISADEGIAIGISAFANCINLDHFNEVQSTYHIDYVSDYSFFNCKRLKNVKLLSTTTHIGVSAFYDCDEIRSIQEYNQYTAENFKYWKLSSVGDAAFMNCDNLTVFYFPRTITSIEDRTFDNCPKLDNIIFDIDTTEFKRRFGERDNAEVSSIIMNKFKDIRHDNQCYISFIDITYTNDGKLKNDNEYVDVGAYDDEKTCVSGFHYVDYYNSPQAYLNLSGINKIDPFVFCNVDKIERVTFLEDHQRGTIEEIGDYSFAKCYNLMYFNNQQLPVTTVGDYAFSDCRLLDTMRFNISKVEHIGQGAFFNTNLSSLVFTECADVSIAIQKVKTAIGWKLNGNRNPLELPDFCQILLLDANGKTIGQYDYILNDLLGSNVDINRNQLVFIDKGRDYVKPLLIVNSKDETHFPAIVANTFHASIVGRWK